MPRLTASTHAARPVLQAVAEPVLGVAAGQSVWRAAHDELRAAGLLAPALGPTVARLLVFGLALLAALLFAWLGGPLAAVAASLPIAGLLAQLAFIGHDAGHGAVHRRPAINRAVGQLAMTVFTGLAFDEWIARHRAHHRHCQDERRDPDMAVDLVVSLTAGSRQRKGRLGRWLTRHQGVLIGPLSLLFAHSQRLQSQAAVLTHPCRHALDAVGLLLHFGLWFGLPCGLLGVPLGLAGLVYLLPLTLLGPYLAAIFWVNHIGMPLVTRAEAFSFLEHQAVTSRTVLNPPRWHWVFGGLNFQVEHHLFPMVPSRRLAAVQPVVQRHLQACGLPYTAVSWPAAARHIHSHLRHVARPA
ncbi:MAG: acyl-CoA desaturase [Rubrivivax sp.]|nr:acyl-CoA desaturase [Rubrivivax sp.]